MKLRIIYEDAVAGTMDTCVKAQDRKLEYSTTQRAIEALMRGGLWMESYTVWIAPGAIKKVQVVEESE